MTLFKRKLIGINSLFYLWHELLNVCSLVWKGLNLVKVHTTKVMEQGKGSNLIQIIQFDIYCQKVETSRWCDGMLLIIYQVFRIGQSPI